MSNYLKTTDFATKDGLATGNPLKLVTGANYDTEFDNIETAIATKTDQVSMTDGTLLTSDANGNIQDSGVAASTLWLPKSTMARATVDQTIDDATWMDMSWGAQVWDELGAYSTSDKQDFHVGTSTTAWYQFIVQAELQGSSQNRTFGLRLETEGNTFESLFNFQATAIYHCNFAKADNITLRLTSPIFQNTAGNDAFRVKVWQENESGVGRDVLYSNGNSWFQVIRWNKT